MRTRDVVVLLAGATVVMACAPPENVPNVAARTVVAPPPVLDRSSVDPAREMVTLERTGCLGSCPVYSLQVLTDGTVRYEGRASVKIEGRRSSHLDARAIARLRQAFEAADFLHATATPPGGIDLPTTTLTYRVGERSHSVSYLAGSGSIEALEVLLEEVTNAVQWIGTEEERATLPSPMDEALLGVLRGDDPPRELPPGG